MLCYQENTTYAAEGQNKKMIEAYSRLSKF
jgi:hypothetical protein